MRPIVDAYRGGITDQVFIDRAFQAGMGEAIVAATLASHGLYVLLHPFTIAGTATGMATVEEYATTWDLDIMASPKDALDPLRSVKGEVKSVSKLCLEDDRQTILCSYSNYIKKFSNSLYLYRDFFLLDKKTLEIHWVPVGTPLDSEKIITDPSRPGKPYRVVTVWGNYVRPLADFVTEFRVVAAL